jgi:hypothetical protein
MLRLDDKRWRELSGGYRMPCDPRPLLAKLEAGQNTEAVWHELWGELHHQGDVGDASYAAVPQIARIYRHHDAVDWNTYAIVAIIDLARGRGRNPTVPDWLEEEYFAAIQELAEIGRLNLSRADSPEDVRSILAVIALSKGLRTHAMFLIEYTEDELLEIDSRTQ